MTTLMLTTPAAGPVAANPWALLPPLGNLDAYFSAVNPLLILTLAPAKAIAQILKKKRYLGEAG